MIPDFIPIGTAIRGRKSRKRRGSTVSWHRPRVRKVGGTFKHAPRSRFFGTGAVMVNPRRRRSVRRNGVLTMRHNPVIVRYGRKAHRRTRHNPFNVKNTLRQITSKRWLITIGTIGGGLVAGMAGKTLILNALPANMKQYSKYVGLGHIVLGALLVGMMKKKALKEVGVVIAATGLYDLVATNVPALGLPALPGYTIPGTAKLSGSYPVSRLPVSAVSAAGVSGNYGVAARAGYAGSFMSTTPQQGFSGVDNPYEGIDW
jgi:hypothetical protein